MIGLIFGETSFPKEILKKIKKRKSKYLIIDLTKSRVFKKDRYSYAVSIGQFGRIINIAAIGGQWGGEEQIHYAISKAGVICLTKSLAKELGSRNINVNCVAPGFIKTEMTSFIDGESEDKIINQIPLNRLGNSEDVAKLVMFLASDEASYITGQTISIDGGLLMY